MANQLLRGIQRQHPKFFRAVAADARTTLAYRAEIHEFSSRIRLILQILRLCWVSDAFLAQVLYRAKARLQRFRIPLIPTIFHRLAMMHSQVCIGNPVVVEAGLYIAHGQVVIDGITRIGSGAVLSPWTTIGLLAGNFEGPNIGSNFHCGTGSKILGPICIGDGVVVGANSVVITDVPAHTTVVGAPARPVQ